MNRSKDAPDDGRPATPEEMSATIRALADKCASLAALLAQRDELLAALREALPELEAAAVAETRRNKAPTGQPPSLAKRERWERARAAIAKARSDP